MRRMSPLRWIWVALLIVTALTACSGAPKLSDDGRLVRDVHALIGELERAYERRDRPAFMAGVAAQFPGRDALQGSADAAFERFSHIELALTVERVHLEGKTATVYLHWDGQWRASADQPIVRQGTARFVVDAEIRPLLTAVLGDNPFAVSPARL